MSFLTKSKKRALSFLLAVALTSSAGAEIYIRNKLVEGSERGGAVFVSRESLQRYFSEQEMARIQLEKDQLLVDGNIMVPVSAEGVPIEKLAGALDFEKRVNEQLGVVDYVPAAMLKKRGASPTEPKRQGREYDVAAARMQTVLRKSPSINDHPELERVRSIGGKLAQNSDMPRLKWNFLITADKNPNAFCCGPGWVAVTSGLLDLGLTDDELAGVLSHELAHGCRKDLEERSYNRGVMNQMEREVKALDLERSKMIIERDHQLRLAEIAREYGQQNDYSEARSEASRLNREIDKLDRAIESKTKRWSTHKQFATDSQFRHKDELDADVKGLYYATRAGYSSEGLMSALGKIARAGAEKFGQAAYQGGFSHPPVRKRLETMQKVLADWRTR